jgi:hypothetical protein
MMMKQNDNYDAAFAAAECKIQIEEIKDWQGRMTKWQQTHEVFLQVQLVVRSIRRDNGRFFYDDALDGRCTATAAAAIRPSADENAPWRCGADDDQHEYISARSNVRLEAIAGRLEQKAQGVPDSLLSAATTQDDDYADRRIGKGMGV